MNKSIRTILFLTMLQQVHITQASHTSKSYEILSAEEKVDFLETKLGFTTIQSRDSRYVCILTNTVGTTYNIDLAGQPILFGTALARGTECTREHSIIRYHNGSQYKKLQNGDHFVRKPGHDDWIFVPEQVRHFFR